MTPIGLKALLINVLLLIAVIPAAHAQQRPGSIEGFVRDLSGKPIANASVYGCTCLIMFSIG
jgi:hypothetical protein